VPSSIDATVFPYPILIMRQLRRAGEIGGVTAERDAEIRRALAEERCVSLKQRGERRVCACVCDACVCRRKLAEALTMTERVAEIVRAMEPRWTRLARLAPPSQPLSVFNRNRFSVLTAEQVWRHRPRARAAAAAAIVLCRFPRHNVLCAADADW
jgi:hypothetical protein